MMMIQNYLIIQVISNYFKIFTCSIKELSEKSITAPVTSEFEVNCLKQDKASFTHRIFVNFFIVYELDTCLHDLHTDFKLKDCFLELLS